MTTVADLLTAGRLEPVPVDLSTATARLARAYQHLQTAASLVGQDNEVAYGSLYDAARKAITAQRCVRLKTPQDTDLRQCEKRRSGQLRAHRIPSARPRMAPT